jgi:hypothetical protein
MQDFPILPVKFGTVLPDESWVSRLLMQEAGLFRNTLATFEARDQMEVVVLWNLEVVFKEISQEEPIAQLKALHPEGTRDRSPEETLAERIALGQMVQAALERRRAALRERLIPPLREVALDMVVNPPMDDSMVANLALLVDQAGNLPPPSPPNLHLNPTLGRDRGGRTALAERLEALDKAFDGQFTFRCVGPLPPYSFATVEVRVPVFEEVDQARRCLGLAETASPGEIKRAYHRLAGRLHPDHNPEDPEAAARMAELSQAYQLLTTLAGERGSMGAGEHGRPYPSTGDAPSPRPSPAFSDRTLCGGRAGEGGSRIAPPPLPGSPAPRLPGSFSREAVEQTLLVAIRRQAAPVGETVQT